MNLSWGFARAHLIFPIFLGLSIRSIKGQVLG